MLFYALLILCAIFTLILWNSRNYWKLKKIIQVDVPIWTIAFSKKSLAEIVKGIYDNYDARHIGLYLGSKPALLLKDLEDVQAVYAGDFQSFHSRGVDFNDNDVLGQGLIFINDYNKWKLLRTKLSPMFTSSKLKTLFYIMEKCSRDFVKYIEEKKEKNIPLAPFDDLYTYTTASIAASIFGIDTKVDSTMDTPFIEMSKKAFAPTLKTNINFSLSNSFPKLFKILQLKFFGEHEDFFIGTVKNVLNTRRQTNENRRDFINLCLELQNKGIMKDFTTGYELEPTDEVIAAQAFFFFVAGADTSASTIHFTLLELAGNPNILTRLHEEIDQVFNNKDELTYADVEKMTYLDKVLSESMRKYPTIGVIQRICTRNTILPSGVKIEKDTIIVLPVLAIHRDERYYPNPELFNPERFAPENASNINKYGYLPFGEGNRICIGARYARLQVKSVLAWTLKKFTLKEQSYRPLRFEPSTFAVRDSTAQYQLIPRS